MKPIRIKENKYSTPWVNDRVRKEIEKKKILLQRWRNNKNNIILYEEYKRQRNITTNVIKKEKRIYVYKLFDEARGDMLKTWKCINDLMDRKIREPLDIKLKTNFQTDNLSQLANEFNKNFIQQVKDIKIKNNGPILEVQTVNHDLHKYKSTMYLRKAKEKEIFKIIKEMKKTGKGIDRLRNKDIVENAALFTPLITQLINQMITQSVIPPQLKTASVTPLYKKRSIKCPREL